MPIYSEPQVKAPDHNTFAVFSAPGWRKTLFFLCKNMNICAIGAMAQPGSNTENGSLWLNKMATRAKNRKRA